MIENNNPFVSLNQPFRDVPDGLKRKVMEDIAMAKILMELAGMFDLNMGTVFECTVELRNA